MNKETIAGVACSALIALSSATAEDLDLEITHIESKEGRFTIKTSYRGASMVLKKVTSPDKSHNTVYYVMHNGHEVLTYKSGPGGTEFAGAGMTRDQVKPDYTIKMAGDKEGRIRRITIYSPDFKTTHDGFWIKNRNLIPWSGEELANWRKLRDSTDETSPPTNSEQFVDESKRKDASWNNQPAKQGK